MRYSYKRSNRGFTLIELSIVLVIIGILISASLKLVGPISLIVKMRETKESQDSTIQSIISWVASRNTLPTKDEFSKIAKSPRDPWGQQFVYLYYSSLSRTNPTKDTICGRRSTPLQLYTNYTSNSVAFAVISRADNSSFMSKLNGADITDSTLSPVAGNINASGTNADIIRWVTLDELRSKIGCQGAPLKIVTTSLSPVTAGSGYAISITADGGVPFTLPSPHQFEWCIKADVTTPALQDSYFTPTPILQSSCDPSNNALWIASPTLGISGAPSGSYSFTAYVRDNDNNLAQRSFGLTVN